MSSSLVFGMLGVSSVVNGIRWVCMVCSVFFFSSLVLLVVIIIGLSIMCGGWCVFSVLVICLIILVLVSMFSFIVWILKLVK